MRVRFAPSPTGNLHLGGFRTALFNILAARSAPGGVAVLRIEDTDQSRLVAGAVPAMLDIFDWAGLRFDEGPGIGGNHGPYVQSERLGLYQDHAHELLHTGHAYRCFCSVAAHRCRTARPNRWRVWQPARLSSLRSNPVKPREHHRTLKPN